MVIDHRTSEVIEKISYDANGNVESDYRPGRWGNSREHYRFTGKEEDVEVGLTYFGARYLSTNLRRWISPDPLTVHGGAGDSNPYAYVGGRTLAFTDPWGLDGNQLDETPVIHHPDGYTTEYRGPNQIEVLDPAPPALELEDERAPSAPEIDANVGESGRRAASPSDQPHRDSAIVQGIKPPPGVLDYAAGAAGPIGGRMLRETVAHFQSTFRPAPQLLDRDQNVVTFSGRIDRTDALPDIAAVVIVPLTAGLSEAGLVLEAAEAAAERVPARLASPATGAGGFSPGTAAPGEVIRGVDPTALQAGRPVLMGGRLLVQRTLIRLGIARDTLIQVTGEGVIWDGNHGARAAIEAGKRIDVQLVRGGATPYGDIMKLPVIGGR